MLWGFSFVKLQKSKARRFKYYQFLIVQICKQNESNLDFKMTALWIIQIMIVTCVKSCNASIPFICSFHVTYSSSIFKKCLLSASRSARYWLHKHNLGSLGPCPVGPTVCWGIRARKCLQFTCHVKAMRTHHMGKAPALDSGREVLDRQGSWVGAPCSLPGLTSLISPLPHKITYCYVPGAVFIFF